MLGAQKILLGAQRRTLSCGMTHLYVKVIATCVCKSERKFSDDKEKENQQRLIQVIATCVL